MATLMTVILLTFEFHFSFLPPLPFISLLLIFILLSYSFCSLVCFLYWVPVNLLHLVPLPNETGFSGWNDHNTTVRRFFSLGSCSNFLQLDPFSPPKCCGFFSHTLSGFNSRAKWEHLLGWEADAIAGVGDL